MASLTHGGAADGSASTSNIAASGSNAQSMEVDGAQAGRSQMLLSTRTNKISKTTTTCGKRMSLFYTITCYRTLWNGHH